MEIPGAPAAIKNALNWKFVLAVLVIAIIVTYAMNKIMKTSLTITDTAGNVIGTGTQEKTFNYNLKKS